MKNADKTAFPFVAELGDRVDVYIGLTKRELFAAMAMQGLNSYPTPADYPIRALAERSVRMADALLEALGDEDG